MNNINSLIIEGNMVRDPVAKTTAKGTKLCTFTIATNRSLKNASGEYVKEVSFFDVETWSKLAEICESKGGKGKGVRIVGRIKQSRWEGTDGKKYSRISIIAEHVEFKPNFSESETQKVDYSPSENESAAECEKECTDECNAESEVEKECVEEVVF